MTRKTRLSPSALPWRYLLFLLLCLGAVPLLLVMPWHMAIMAAFDAATLVFLMTLRSLYRYDEGNIRDHARRNDANREIFLAITAIVSLTILVAVGAELSARGGEGPKPATIALVIVTLMLAWAFSNIVYAFHYAYLYYSANEGGGDCAGISFPGEDRAPDYWDFTYFSFTLGMTFQTSDVQIETVGIRKVALFHSVAAFIFNLGIIAFTINILGG